MFKFSKKFLAFLRFKNDIYSERRSEIMNNLNLTLILTQTTLSPEGKATKSTRRFNQIKSTATDQELLSFAKAIEALSGEHYDSIESVKTEQIG